MNIGETAKGCKHSYLQNGIEKCLDAKWEKHTGGSKGGMKHLLSSILSFLNIKPLSAKPSIRFQSQP